MLLALSYAIEFAVQAVFMSAALWVMIKLQNLSHTFLGLLICGALSSAIDIIPYFGHYLAVPTLYVCVARMTRAEVFPDAVFTVVIAYALTFCMNLFLLGAMLGDLRPSAFDEPDEVVAGLTEDMEDADEMTGITTNQFAAVKTNAATIYPPKLKPAATKHAPVSKLSEATIKSITLKGINSGATEASAVVSDGKRTFTLGVGESRSVPTSDGSVTVKCERITTNTVQLSLNGEPVMLTLW